jgi:hypothetical protein
MAEEQKATEQQAEQADLEVEEEQAEKVEGGGRGRSTPEEQGFKRGAPDSQARR